MFDYEKTEIINRLRLLFGKSIIYLKIINTERKKFYDSRDCNKKENA